MRPGHAPSPRPWLQAQRKHKAISSWLPAEREQPAQAQCRHLAPNARPWAQWKHVAAKPQLPARHRRPAPPVWPQAQCGGLYRRQQVQTAPHCCQLRAGSARSRGARLMRRMLKSRHTTVVASYISTCLPACGAQALPDLLPKSSPRPQSESEQLWIAESACSVRGCKAQRGACKET